ncbi:MAG: hypothetical protein JJU02_15260 [Cryomorphaceae bacterium]|nr:hypothetical protein [Cryomorphaceae bacterium]
MEKRHIFKKQILLIPALFVLGLGSCYYDNEEDLYQDIGNDCETTDLSFQRDIKPIIDGECVVCHGNNDPIGGISLTEYSHVSGAATNIKDRINRPPGDALRMPQGGMDPCKVEKLNVWINQGALDN